MVTIYHKDESMREQFWNHKKNTTNQTAFFCFETKLLISLHQNSCIELVMLFSESNALSSWFDAASLAISPCWKSQSWGSWSVKMVRSLLHFFNWSKNEILLRSQDTINVLFAGNSSRINRHLRLISLERHLTSDKENLTTRFNRWNFLIKLRKFFTVL